MVEEGDVGQKSTPLLVDTAPISLPTSDTALLNNGSRNASETVASTKVNIDDNGLRQNVSIAQLPKNITNVSEIVTSPRVNVESNVTSSILENRLNDTKLVEPSRDNASTVAISNYQGVYFVVLNVITPFPGFHHYNLFDLNKTFI